MYVVVAPKVLRSNTDYHISVSLYDIPAPIEVNASVIGPAHSVSTGAVAVGTAESKVLTLAIGDWTEGRYRVQVEGKGANFINDDEPWHITRDGFLDKMFPYYEAKCLSVFIQTDKATYKPGQKVQFRAVVVNPSLIPKDNVPIDIYIEDGNGKRVIEWTKLYAKNGVIAEELQLSAQPVLGHWTIGVTACRHNTTKTFTVVDDMFPTFDVEVVLPTYVTRNRSEVVALIKAFDTNGKAIKGELTLIARTINFYRPSKFLTKTAIDGSANLTISLADDLLYKVHVNNMPREFAVTAVVRDALTGKQCNRTNTVKAYERDLKFEVIAPLNAYKPGLKNTFVVKVCTQDGKPVADSGPQLKLKYGYSWNDNKWTDSPLLLWPTNGFIKFDIIPPRDMGINELVVKTEYMGHTYALDIKRATTRSGHYMQVIRLDTTDITVGQDVKFVVNATEPIVRLVCEVLGKGDIAWAKSFDIPANTTAGYEFSVATVPQMAPSARVLCHYVRPSDQEVVADDIDFDVLPVIGTPFTVNADTRHTSPGEFGCVGLNTSDNPFVDISREDVLNELKTYVRTTRNSPSYGMRGRWHSTRITFVDAGVEVMHNGFIEHG
ncbi:unnamed protein product [Medioppia subpectinata]|uniref:TEP1-F n=1 Tax=Medioppia subpectinata TaxID=1979941 RepID=A0A7R9PZ62_9ACAR|nr:unnamed protein product [Medioppia subpectinata]CAG2106122.1 unnamed protein product [Medioppia subpectinata]